ncbi:MAG TPA: YfhO family protein [Pedobacter sp.]
MNNWFKRNTVHFIIGAIFLAICFLYFSPSFSGKTLGQNDVTRAQSTQTEINAYKEKGITILWTNQIHGGMPAFQIWAPYSNNITNWFISAINVIFPNPVGTVFILLSGTYLLFCVFKLNPWLAAAGAIAFTFSSYNIILLAAGHANQALAIAFFAPVLAGILLVFRKRYLTGAALTALFLALEIRANHIQMTYYLLLAILILTGIELYNAVKTKTTRAFLQSILYLAAAALLALAVNASILWSTYDYGKDTIRGKSNLTQHTTAPGNGLPRDYAYQWSQGVGESITFLIPGAYGGSSRGPVNKDSNVIKALTDIGADASQAQYISQNGLPLYWGEKPFTEGSFYFGAVICFLFVSGLFIVKSPIKWWLTGVIVLTLLLSFGKNWPYISDLFFNYVPLYNKFRAVESILAVAGLCFPILALLAANEIIVNDNKTELLKKLKISFYITGGICLIVAVIPGLFLSFKNSNHEAFITQLSQMLKIDMPKANSLANALVEDRTAAAQSDAIRSLIFVGLTFTITWAFIKKKINVLTLSLGILGLVLIDFWAVDKRYLNNDSFVSKQDVQKPALREADTFILRDRDPDYRVIDLTQSILSDQVTPYFHKAIGGYSAARLKRFDELVESQLTKSINPEVLNMLNTKYIILSNPASQQLTVKQNPDASGHAWFVRKLRFVPDADAEMQAITNFAPKETAITDQKYKSIIDQQQIAPDSTARIDLVSYSPDHMVYQSKSAKPQIAVFSEIWYDKGWTMMIDGVEKPYFRADYVLRAAQIPAGSHKVEFSFHPASYYTGEKISLAGSVLLILALCGTAYAEIRKKKV